MLAVYCLVLAIGIFVELNVYTIIHHPGYLRLAPRLDRRSRRGIAPGAPPVLKRMHTENQGVPIHREPPSDSACPTCIGPRIPRICPF